MLKKILESSLELIKKSFGLRKYLNRKNPEMRLFCWDAGWVQISFVLNNNFKEDINNFSCSVENLYNRLCDNIYNFGFLKQNFYDPNKKLLFIDAKEGDEFPKNRKNM